MKTFIISCFGLVLVSLIVEIFCPAKIMKTSLYMAFSLVVLVVMVDGIKGAFKTDLENNNFPSLKLEQSGNAIFSGSVKSTERQIENALKNEGIDVGAVELDYYVNELKVVITGASIKLKDEQDLDKTKEIIKEITGLKDEEIEIWGNS